MNCEFGSSEFRVAAFAAFLAGILAAVREPARLRYRICYHHERWRNLDEEVSAGSDAVLQERALSGGE